MPAINLGRRRGPAARIADLSLLTFLKTHMDGRPIDSLTVGELIAAVRRAECKRPSEAGPVVDDVDALAARLIAHSDQMRAEIRALDASARGAVDEDLVRDLQSRATELTVRWDAFEREAWETLRRARAR